MNLIIEFNAFGRYVETNPLPMGTQLLYYRLLYHHNKANWERVIILSNDRLMADLGVSINTLIVHRNNLIEAGILEYKSRKKERKFGEYKLLSFEKKGVKSANTTSGFSSKIEPEPEVDNITFSNFEVEDEVKPEHLYKQNETKPDVYSTTIDTTQKIDKDLNLLLEICKQNNFVVDKNTINVLEAMRKFYKVDLIEKAIIEANFKGKHNLGYVNGILKNWTSSGQIILSSDIQAPENMQDKNIINPKIRKNRFHNFEQRTTNYSADDLEAICAKIRQAHYDKIVHVKMK